MTFVNWKPAICALILVLGASGCGADDESDPGTNEVNTDAAATMTVDPSDPDRTIPEGEAPPGLADPGAQSGAWNEGRQACRTLGPDGLAEEYGGDRSDVRELAERYAEAEFADNDRASAALGCAQGLAER